MILAAENHHLFILNGANIVDYDSFFKQACLDLPQWMDTNNWNSFLDVIRDTFDEVNEPYIDILWLDAHNMLNGNLRFLLEATDFFAGLSNEYEKNHDQPLRGITLFLLGEGENFPAFKTNQPPITERVNSLRQLGTLFFHLADLVPGRPSVWPVR